MTVLVLRALGLGDFFTGLPALAMLRAALPDERIVLAVPTAFHELALLSGSVDATVHAHELEPIGGDVRRPEIALDLHGNGPESRALLAATDPGRLVAFGAPGPVWDRSEHEVERWGRLVREGLPAPGMVTPSVAGALPAPELTSPAPGATLIHVGAAYSSRRWYPLRFAAVAAQLRRAGHHVVVLGGPAESRLAGAVALAAGVRALVPRGLMELAALVAGARLVVSGDTGVAHVASNYAVPSVVLFGPVSPLVWGPPPNPRHQVIWRGDGTGDPHGSVMDPALARIQVSEVVAACQQALLHAPASSHA